MHNNEPAFINPMYKNPLWHFQSEIYDLEERISERKKDGLGSQESIRRLVSMYEQTSFPAAKHLAGRALTRNGVKGYSYSSSRIFLYEHKLSIAITAASLCGLTALVYAILKN